ncbi:MAG: 2Fe-2S iron-sulfur cluster-binding protein [Haloarculaceae archaeon]
MAVGGSTHTVTLVDEDGSREGLEIEEGQTILQATDEAGVDLRYGCREGKCVSCTGLLIDGEVEYVRTPAALNDRQRREGFVLLCICTPRTDCKVEVGKHVLAEAFPTLWRQESGSRALDQLREARRKLRTVSEVDPHEEEHLDHLRGAMGIFPNLHEMYEAYHRCDVDDHRRDEN